MIDFMVRGLRLWYNVGMIWVKERLKPVGAVGGVVLVVVTLSCQGGWRERCSGNWHPILTTEVFSEKIAL